ncbi:MAG: MotA/TolQ/ExbB proton channel family protein [Vicinamibacterales bacterium]|nr:MotA/TolQ/ExbB proton channel family protein [Vicinamibacterales bacterium]HJN45248.1 MotA/TolQ/ExbB proton channel family protein [Vicinamibacterales bacterium]
MRTFGYYAIALQSQALGASGEGVGGDVLALVAAASPLQKGVLLILALFSISSWGVVFLKLWQFRRLEQQTSSFLDIFRRSTKFSEVQPVCRSLTHSPLVGVFQAGYAELNTQLRQGDAAPDSAGRPSTAIGRPTLRSFDALDRALLRAAAVEINKLEQRVHLLATTASITPFIGLFGTVMGIMAAFTGIAETGSTNLGIVAQPIAEALIATAAGLAAAIPAVYFYNYLTHKVKIYMSTMEDFSMEFLNIAERNFT